MISKIRIAEVTVAVSGLTPVLIGQPVALRVTATDERGMGEHTPNGLT